MYYVYMIRCEDNSLYTGFTTDIKRRWEEHTKKDKTYAKYTRSHTVKSIAALWETEDRSAAFKLEYHIKKLKKAQKEEIIKDNGKITEFLGEKLDKNVYNAVRTDTLDFLEDSVLLCDMHTHSKNAHDSTNLIIDSAKFCVKNGISIFAVTDHCDINNYFGQDVFSCIRKSQEEVEQTQKEFQGKVKILKGIELGDGIWDKKRADEILQAFDFDVVIGSIHSVRYKDYTNPYSKIDFSKMTSEDIDGYLQAYFDDVFTMLKEIPCDIMAHLTCPVRYINGEHNLNIDIIKYKDKICKILEYIIAHSIALEVNTSGVSTSLGYFMPDEWIVRMYKDMGGKFVTLGSDAHIADNVGRDFTKAIDMLKKCGYESYYYFQNRKKVKCRI